jgi:hypothetical protein
MVVQKNVRLHRQASDNNVLGLLLRIICLYSHKPQPHVRGKMTRSIMEFDTHTMYAAQASLCKPARLSA